MLLRKANILLFGVSLASVAVAVCAHAQARPPALPAELDDREFWQVIVDVSEPGGHFEDENFVSNEAGYERVMRRLQDAVKPGGVYLGVGPEQNFTYIAALRPRIAFIVDVRRQNMIEHLMYKALFELSEDRADYLSRLFSRPRPAGLDAGSSVQALFQAYGAARADRRLFEENLARILAVLTERHRFGLTSDDRASMLKVFTAFYESGPDLKYVFRGTAEIHPTYTSLMTAADEGGQHWSYLGTADRFQHIRQMQRRNLIVPVVGDFAGPKTLRAVGAYVRDHGGTINVFYVSNVEPYLFRSGSWKAFYENVMTLPLEGSGLFIRTFFGATARECRAQRPVIRTPVLGSMAPLLSAYRRGDVKTQCDLVAWSR
jgi:hypothetical protein